MKFTLSLLGVAFAVFFGLMLWLEQHTPPVHAGHLYFFGGGMGVGLLLIPGVAGALATGLTAVGGAVGKYLPWMKSGGGTP